MSSFKDWLRGCAIIRIGFSRGGRFDAEVGWFWIAGMVLIILWGAR